MFIGERPSISAFWEASSIVKRSSLFQKVLADNPELTSATLTGIDAKRPATLTHAIVQGVHPRLADLDLPNFARAPYDSRNEKVFLRLDIAGAAYRFGGRFDNPDFWIGSPQANEEL